MTATRVPFKPKPRAILLQRLLVRSSLYRDFPRSVSNFH
jgi:hypothetical protein